MFCRNPGFLAEALRDARRHNYALGVKLVRGAYHEYEIHAHSDAKSKGGSVSISPDPEPPVWMTKSETDACFNEGVQTLVRAIAADVRASNSRSWRDTKNWWSISSASRTNSNTALSVPRIAVIFGTHNWESCDVVLEELVKANLASKEEIQEEGKKGKRSVVSVRDDVAQRVAIAQLYGMCDDLTDSLVERARSKTPLVMKYAQIPCLFWTRLMSLGISHSVHFLRYYPTLVDVLLRISRCLDKAELRERGRELGD